MTVPKHVSESIDAMAGLHEAARLMSVHQRGMDWLTSALTRPHFLYSTIAFGVGWIGVNLALPVAGLPPFDGPPFHLLHLILTFVALLMATFVLATQERQVRHAEIRSHLDLQINLLSEQKIAKVIALVEELRRDLPNVRNRHDESAVAMAAPTDPQVVAEALAACLPLPDRDA
jgi:uncharacterized membrane protein